ncbi:MAG: single-stranded-DNA-specific exonuclease [Archaeoglobi archaeon]|nr:DHH family phosphoesterase [Candidatus Mnemosynella bozhongmuii]MDK2781041.1 single-stranded-DNA-specific exonuclease [Archaeoglobi archaeon]
MIERLNELAKEVAEFLSAKDYVTVVSHHDADGITAASIISHALNRRGIPFHVTIHSKLTPEVVASVEEPVVFCDMGSAEPELLEGLEDFAVIDHHRPYGELSVPHINPHLAGIDGAFQLSASCLAYLVSRRMGENFDLSALALAGAVGDKQELRDANREILEEGIREGVLKVSKGLRIGSGDLKDLLLLSHEPYIDGISGDEDGAEEFLKKIGLEGKKYEELNEEEVKKLTSAIILKLMDSTREEVLKSLVGEIVWCEGELLKDIFTLSNVVNACGKLERSGTGVAVCLRDERFLDEALELHRKYSMKIVEEVRRATRELSALRFLKYVWVKDEGITGAVAGVLARYVVTDSPVLALRKVNGTVRISARGNEELVKRGIDLGEILRISSRAVGGSGGGHNIAAGASVPEDRIEEFLEIVDERVGEILSG